MKPDNGSEAMLKIARQFMESRILLSAAEMNLFTLLDKVPSTAKDLAGRINADLRGLTILLNALTAMGLLSKKKDLYLTAPDVVPFLTEDSPRSVLPMILHSVHLWDSWSDLTPIVKGAGLSKLPRNAVRKADELRAFIGAMHTVGAPLAQKIVTAIQPGSARNMIDVGGASGTYTIAFLKAVPEMKATLFDRPEVIQIAREHLARESMLDRVHLVAGDFYKDELPGGHDMAFLSAIIHQNSPLRNVELFRKVLRAIIPGGRLIIRDHVMEPGRTKPKDGSIFAVNMLVNTAEGSTYTFDEIKSWLTGTGFVNVSLLKSGQHMDALVEAFKTNKKD